MSEPFVNTEDSKRSAVEILAEMSDFLTGTVPVADAIERALTELLSFLGGDLSLIVTTLTEDGAHLVVRGRRAYLPEYLFEQVAEQRAVSEALVSQQVLLEGRPMLYSFVNEKDRIRGWSGRVPVAPIYAVFYLPLLVRGRPIGILHINIWEHARQFTPKEVALCQGMANLLAAAIENGRLLTAEREQLHLARTLQKVGALLTTQLSLESLFDQIFSLLAEVVAYDSVSIQLVDRVTNRMKLVAARGFELLEQEEPILEEIAHHSLEKFPAGAHVAVISDTHASDLWVHGALVAQIRSWIGALLRVKGQTIGVLNVDSYTLDAFHHEDGELVAAFANQAAIAIENTRLHNETDRRAKELAVLHQLALDTASVVNLDELFAQTTQAIVAALYPEHFGILLVDESSQQIWPHPSYHGVQADMLTKPVLFHGSLCGLVVETGQPYLLDDVRESSHYLAASADTLSEVAVPIKLADEVMGVINVESHRFGAFSGSDVVFLTTLSALLSASIDRARMVWQLHDHSRNLAAEVDRQTAALKSERDRTIAILENAGESILLLDNFARIVYVNKALEMQSGYQRDMLIGQTPRFLEGGRTVIAAYTEFWDKLVRGESWTGQLVNRRRDGSFYDVAVSMAPVMDAAGELMSFVIVESDITRMKEVERLKTEFVANVTHELRTPLTNIKTYVTLAERGREEQRSRYFQILHHETDRLTQLIQDLLDLSHLQTESLPTVVGVVNLTAVVQEYVDIFQAKADVKNIELKLLPPVVETAVPLADKHIGQLLTNLLGNAIAYTPAGGRVTVAVGKDADRPEQPVWFQVIDTGMGISEEELPYLFDRFYRGALGKEHGIPGTGLGLAICDEILKRYHGDITVVSQSGVGTTFTVYLPEAVPHNGESADD